MFFKNIFMVDFSKKFIPVEEEEKTVLTVVSDQEKEKSSAKKEKDIPLLDRTQEHTTNDQARYRIDKGTPNFIQDILQNHVPVLANMPHHEGEDLSTLAQPKPTIEEFREEILIEDEGEPLTQEDFEFAAELIIEIFEWITSAGFMWLSGDKQDTEYLFSETKKARIQKMLIRYMIYKSKDKKANPGAALGIALALMLVVPARKAITNRKLNKKGIKHTPAAAQNTEDVKHTEETAENYEEIKAKMPFKFGKKYDEAPILKPKEEVKEEVHKAEVLNGKKQD